MASSKNRKIVFLALITCLQNACLVDAGAYFADWSALAEDRQPTCVAIPSNMSLCTNIGYNKMRLPNLLEHDTIQEASQQAAYWVPLIQSNCSEHTKLFLCSLFAPVCLDRPIYPCRSLCQKVKAGCEGTMKSRGFPWPPMLDCNKFPLDNDMCITSQAESEQNRKKEEEKKNAKAGSAKSGNKADGNAATATAKNNNQDGNTNCQAKVCNEAPTKQNILTNYCEADFVVKMKFKSVKRRSLRGRKVNTVYKTWKRNGDFRKLRKPRLQLEADHQCCSKWIQTHSRRQRFLVMGKNLDNRLVPTFIVPWSRDKEMKQARKMFKQIDCSTWSSGVSTKSASSFPDQTTQFSHRKKSSRRNRRENERNINKQRHQHQKQRKRKHDDARH